MISSFIGPILTTFERYTWKYDENLITLASYALALQLPHVFLCFLAYFNNFYMLNFLKVLLT